MRYVAVPRELTLDEVEANNFVLSSALYRRALIPNKNVRPLRDLLKRPLHNTDLGQEVGSLYYMRHSTHYFLRTKALQAHSYLPDVTPESAVPISPKVFVQRNLRAGDVLMSKDSNIGEVVMLDQDYPNHMASGALYRLPLADTHKLYTLAFLKHDLFREQLDLLVPAGATIRHAKTLFLDCLIPFPNQPDAADVVAYVEALTRAVMAKEKKIRARHRQILGDIALELAHNQKPGSFVYEDPTIDDVLRIGRFDTSLYTRKFKQHNFTVLNYRHGHKSLPDLGFQAARGTSLEIKALGTRLDSDVPLPGYYKLLIPANISDYGTEDRSTYIGTPTQLKTIQRGDIIFGGEGFGKGRCLVVCADVDNIATNYHGIRIYKPKASLTESIFIRCFLSYWRSLGMIDYIGVGGSGGHCAPSYFYLIETPLFPEAVQLGIAALYHTPGVAYATPAALTLATFTAADGAFTAAAGIVELDRAAKQLRARLDAVLDAIARDAPVDIRFDFLA